MTDHSPTSPDSSVPPYQPVGLLNAEFLCPICHQVVVSITGNELQYLTNHTHDVKDPAGYASATDQGSYTSLLMYHLAPQGGPTPPEYQPGGARLLPVEAFLLVQSLEIVPLKGE